MSRVSRRKAERCGAVSAKHDNADLWKLSKREILEVALHLAAQVVGEYPQAFDNGRALERVKEEIRFLKGAKLI